jgi:sialic acid synthase SpsE
MGAQIVERHFTIDRTMKGSDHAASLEPNGLQKLVRDIRAVEKALGKGEKKLLECEIPIRKKLAKSVVTSKKIARGTQITRAMLTTKGPGTGLPAWKIDKVVGRKARVDIEADIVLQEEHLS